MFVHAGHRSSLKIDRPSFPRKEKLSLLGVLSELQQHTKHNIRMSYRHTYVVIIIVVGKMS